jgi:hypothetical protein
MLVLGKPHRSPFPKLNEYAIQGHRIIWGTDAYTKQYHLIESWLVDRVLDAVAIGALILIGLTIFTVIGVLVWLLSG